MHYWFARVAAVCLTVGMSVAGAWAEDRDTELAWSQSDSALELVCGGHTLWKFRYGAELSKPYFHPLALTDGTVLTVDRPSDHPWHHGLWFSWKYVNGVNFWEEDRKTGRSRGRLVWQPPAVTTNRDFSASIELQLEYFAHAGQPAVMQEKRHITVSAPQPDGSYSIGFEQTFTALQDVVLGRTPITGEPGGKSWGGYAGLSVRLAGSVTNRQIIADSKILTGAASFHCEGRAMDYSGLFAGKPAGISIVDSPANPGSSVVWYAIDDPRHKFYYFSPAVIYRKPCRLEKGAEMKLAYRVIVHSGRWDSQRVAEAVAEYTSQAK